MDNVGVPDNVGTEPTISGNDWLALPSLLVAVISTLKDPVTVGIPEITPVEFIVIPLGAPEIEKVGAGFADADTI